MWVTGRTIQYPSTRWLQLGSNACVSSFNSCMYIRAVFNQTGQGSLHILSVTCMFGAALLDFSDGWETLKPTSLMGTDYRLCLHTTNEQTAFSLCLFAQIYRYCRHNRNRRMGPQSWTLAATERWSRGGWSWNRAGQQPVSSHALTWGEPPGEKPWLETGEVGDWLAEDPTLLRYCWREEAWYRRIRLKLHTIEDYRRRCLDDAFILR